MNPYERVLRLALGHPLLLAVFCLLLIGGSYVCYRNCGSDLLPAMDEGGFIIDYIMPAGSSLEETNRAYAIAKIAGIELCRSLNRQYGTDYLSLMPTNLYGPGDNFDLRTSHVLPAMIRKFHEAKLGLPDADGAPRPANAPVVLWGTGSPRRELLHVDDLAEAVVCLLEHVAAADLPDGLVNVGTGHDQTIAALAELTQRVVGHTGPIEWDTSKPDGTPQKQLDVSRISALGWRPRYGLADGIRSTYEWYVAHAAGGDGRHGGDGPGAHGPTKTGAA